MLLFAFNAMPDRVTHEVTLSGMVASSITLNAYAKDAMRNHIKFFSFGITRTASI